MFTADLFEPSKPAIGLEVFNQLMQCVERNSGCDLAIGIEVKNITAQEARYILGQYRAISKDDKEAGLAFLSDVREIEGCLECIDDRTQGADQAHFVNADQYAEPSNYQVRETDRTNMPIGSPKSFATHEEALAYAKECKATNPNHKFAIYRVAFAMNQAGVPSDAGSVAEDQLTTEIYSVAIQNTKTGGKRNVEMRVSGGSPEAKALEYLQANETIKSITPKEGVLDSVDEAVETELDLHKGVIPSEPIDEGWSDAIVSQRTGQPRTPYSVYIKGKKWKDFENDDHAEAVANKLRAKFKADGRDPSVITIAATDYDKDIKETAGVTDFNPPSQGGTRKELLAKYAKTGSAQDAAACVRAGASQMELKAAHPGKSIGEDKKKTLKNTNPCWKGYKPVGTKEKDGRTVPNCVPVEEASSPAQQAAIAVNMKKAHKKPADVSEEADTSKVDTKTLQSIHALHKTNGERGDTRSAQSAQRIAAELAKRGVKVAEGAVDNLEARRIDDLNMKMLELLDRAKTARGPARDALKREFQKAKAERDSYFKINPRTGMDPTGSIGTTKGALDEAESRANFKTRLDAIGYAKGKVKTHRDPFDGIEIWAIDDGFDVNHTMNANGRNWLKDNGAKHITTVYPNKLDVDSNKVSEGTDWKEYERKVAALEKKGLSRSDAQGVVDAQMMQTKVSEGFTPDTNYKYIVVVDGEEHGDYDSAEEAKDVVRKLRTQAPGHNFKIKQRARTSARSVKKFSKSREVDEGIKVAPLSQARYGVYVNGQIHITFEDEAGAKQWAKSKKEHNPKSDVEIKKVIINPGGNTPRSVSIVDEAKQPGLWANIRAKQKRIKNGSGERMRKPGSDGAPSDEALKKTRATSEGYQVVQGIDKDKYVERPGLEGPFHTKSGKVVYYDKREGKYYDPDTDFYISHDDWNKMNEGRDGQYHERNPKIDLFHRETKKYLGSTNWYTTVRAAVQSMEEKHPELAGKVIGQKSVKEADQKKNIEPRNFVAKNMKQSGQGQHRDAKRAQKQGDFKHKRDAVPMDEASDGDVNFGSTMSKGSWIVYDQATKQIKKRFKTRTAGKSYAQTHNLGFASSEFYFDNIKQDVAESVHDGLASTIFRRILASNRDVLSRHSSEAVLDAAREEAMIGDTDNIDELVAKTINTLDHEMRSPREFVEGDYDAPNTWKAIKKKAWHTNYYGGLDEAATGIGRTVKVIKGPADVVGKVGTVGEIRNGRFDSDTRIYTVDFEDGSSVQLRGTSLRQVKDTVDESIGELANHASNMYSVYQFLKQNAIPVSLFAASVGLYGLHTTIENLKDDEHKFVAKAKAAWQKLDKGRIEKISAKLNNMFIDSAKSIKVDDPNNYVSDLVEARDELKPGQYYVWTAKFDDGTSSRVKVTTDDFNAKDFYAKKGKNVINVDYDWTIHGTEDKSAQAGAAKKLSQVDSEVEQSDTDENH